LLNKWRESEAEYQQLTAQAEGLFFAIIEFWLRRLQVVTHAGVKPMTRCCT
jgi:hypothetical protein